MRRTSHPLLVLAAIVAIGLVAGSGQVAGVPGPQAAPVTVIPASAVNGAGVLNGPLTLGTSAATQLYVATGTISSANITGTSAGQFGNAAGYPVVAAPGAGKSIVYVSGTVTSIFGVAAYTGGGNTTFNVAGNGAISGLIAAANFSGAAASASFFLTPSTQNLIYPGNLGLNLVTTAPFTQPGTATGTINYTVFYMIVTL